MKRIVALVLLVFAALVALPVAASAQEAGRVVIVTLDGTSLEDWLRADTFHLRRTLTEGTPGLLSTRTAEPRAQTEGACLGRAGDALATMLLGVRASSKDLTGSEPLRQTLAAAGISMGIPVPQRTDSAFPTGRRTDFPALTAAYRASRDRVVLMRIADTLAADCAGGAERDRWVSVALGRADAIIGVVRSSLTPADRLIVLSGAAPWRQERAKNYLTAATIEDPARDDTTVLTSASTRRRGVVTLADVGSTVAALMGTGTVIGVGQPWEPAAGSLGYLRRAAAGFAHGAALRLPLLRGLVWTAAGVLLLAAVLVIAGRGRARGGRVPRTVRDWVAFALLTIVAAPFAIVAEPLAGATSTAGGIAVSIGIAAAVAGAATVARGLRGAMGICAGASAAGLIAFFGDGELGARSALSFSVAAADRFYGVGNEMMGAGLAATLLAAGALLDRRPAAVPWVVAVALVVVAGIAAPPLGAKFGSAFVTVPAFGAMIVLASGRRRTREAVLAIVIATVFVAAAIAAWDHLASPETQSHIARAGRDGATLGRKVAAALQLAAGSYWTAGVLVPAAIALILIRRRSALLARGLWGMPNLRAALGACVVAAAGAIAFNDAGIVAASLIAIAAASVLLHALLCGQSLPPPPGPRSVRIRAFLR